MNDSTVILCSFLFASGKANVFDDHKGRFKRKHGKASHRSRLLRMSQDSYPTPHQALPRLIKMPKHAVCNSVPIQCKLNIRFSKT